ncbi:hypothetical protein ACP4OV_015898 [Aristida adscensionis]
MPPPPPPPPPMPELTEDLVREILHCLPPDDPAALLRAGLVCKRWRRILADPAFRRRHRALHPTPPVIGFILILRGNAPYASRFVPNNPASGRPAARDLPGWLVLDCRHGRALFATQGPGLILWDPLTDEQRRLPRPWALPTPGASHFNAAVLCAAAGEGCDHRGCRGGPFRVAFIWTRHVDGGCITSACFYSSETGDWSMVASVQHPYVSVNLPPCTSALVGDAIHFRGHQSHIFKYQFGVQLLSVIGLPVRSGYREALSSPMSMEDGRLGFASVKEETSLSLCLWSRETAPGGVAQWVPGRAIELEPLLPDGAVPSPLLPSVGHCPRAFVLGFAEGTDTIFLGTWAPPAVYMVQLNSGSARKLFDDCTLVFAYTSFCIPVIDAGSTSECPREGVSSARQTQVADAQASKRCRKCVVVLSNCIHWIL